jgi:CHAT domain-containing protein
VADVSESYLITYDGKLSMGELGDLVGRTRFREGGIELLTLSACQTAAGDDRAALGLAGVALRAGARSALATLWSVNDRAAAALVTEFYTQLGDPNVSRAEALQRAQLKTLRNHAFRHPNYWSPYLLISNWL